MKHFPFKKEYYLLINTGKINMNKNNINNIIMIEYAIMFCFESHIINLWENKQCFDAIWVSVIAIWLTWLCNKIHTSIIATAMENYWIHNNNNNNDYYYHISEIENTRIWSVEKYCWCISMTTQHCDDRTTWLY